MLTKYKLKIGAKEYELQDADLKNWGDIKCAYKRAEYGGVVRSFTSKFEFVNNAYRLLLEEFDNKGFAAQATFYLYTADNNWVYKLAYQCDLDFSTLQYTDYVLSINAIDNSVESVIKANKSTKYEFVIGEDVAVNGSQYLFDRLKMIETVTYEITDGETQDDGSLFGDYNPANGGRIYMGTVGSEICIGGLISPNEDQEYGNGYMLKALKAVDVTLDYSIATSIERGCAQLDLMVNDQVAQKLHDPTQKSAPWIWVDAISIDEVMAYIRRDPQLSNQWDTESLDGRWMTIAGIVWVVRHDAVLGGNEWVNTGKTKEEYVSDISEGQVILHLKADDIVWLRYTSDKSEFFSIMKSSLKFSWQSRGDAVSIDCVSPAELLEAILGKMGVSYDCEISQYDARLANTLLLAAESIRAIPGAKMYASFNDICNWLETVFGYVYVIDDELGIVEFKHRKEIFSATAPVIEIDDAKDFEYKTENSVLYSSITIGYDKKDYDSVNGRDEFNFSTTYTTGYNNGKKLELKSPFRADSYGIEFLAEKRSQQTTDNSSDKDVFFVTGIFSNGCYKPNRTPVIQNSITGSLLNGEFSPMRCAFVNQEYISLMATSMELAFASTEGNGAIVIDGNGMSDDQPLEDCEMLTAGELTFSCSDITMPDDRNSLIRVKSADYVYEGFIRQATFNIARPEAVDYTIMIKSKLPC